MDLTKDTERLGIEAFVLAPALVLAGTGDDGWLLGSDVGPLVVLASSFNWARQRVSLLSIRLLLFFPIKRSDGLTNAEQRGRVLASADDTSRPIQKHASWADRSIVCFASFGDRRHCDMR